MPFMDGTGPWGQGPMTGRGMGYCAGAVRPGFPPGPNIGWFGRGRGMGRGSGRGRGMGRGMGRGFGRGWGAPFYGAAPAYGPAPYGPQMTRAEEVDFLKEEANSVKAQLEEIESRMRDLEAEKE